jgi:hypothetical protein
VGGSNGQGGGQAQGGVGTTQSGQAATGADKVPGGTLPNSSYATTGVQANFGSKLTPDSRPISNGHLNITP